MKVNKFTKRVLQYRRETKKMNAAGFVLVEPDWEIMRGSRQDEVVLDVKICCDRKHIWVQIGKDERICHE